MTAGTKAKAKDLMAGRSVLAQHAALAQELKSAHAAENDYRSDLRRAKVAIERANAERLALYQKKARGTLEGLEDLNAAENEWHAARRDEASFEGQLEAARAAIETVQNEIQALYSVHLPTFAAEAEKRTREAGDALAALHEPYARAHHAWQQARAAWLPLQDAIYMAAATADHDDGIWRDQTKTQRSAQVPELPLPNPAFLHGIPAARPPAMEPAGQREAAAELGEGDGGEAA